MFTRHDKFPTSEKITLLILDSDCNWDRNLMNWRRQFDHLIVKVSDVSIGIGHQDGRSSRAPLFKGKT